MKYSHVLFFIITINTIPLIGMETRSHTKKRFLTTPPTTATTTKKAKLDHKKLQTQCIYLEHHLEGLLATISHYDKNNTIIGNPQLVHLPKNQSCIHYEHAIQIRLILPTSPSIVYLTVPHEKLSHNDNVVITNDAESVSIKNSTRDEILITLPKQNTCLCIGKPGHTFDEHKNINIKNINVPFVQLEHVLYQQPLYYATHHKNLHMPVEGSDIFRTFVTSLRANKRITSRFEQYKNPDITDQAIIIKPFGALQNIKMWPASILLSNPCTLTLQSDEEGSISLMYSDNKNNVRILATVHTHKSSIVI